jgi:hypothetical protein
MRMFLNLASIKLQPFRRLLPLLAVTVTLLANTGRAFDDTFYNNTLYTSAGNINATNFLNDYGGTFNVNPGLGSGWISDLYQAWYYTRNYTNYGVMDSYTGFRFDRQASGHSMASSFYNEGTINCGSSSNAIFIISPFGLFTTIGGYGGIYVWSTNIFNSGTITVGSGGLGLMSGRNIEFNRGSLIMQSASTGNTATANVYATGQTGRNTNAWSPAAYLQQSSAQSSPPMFFSLPNTTPFFDVQNNGPSNVVVRMVFVQNDNLNVPYNVYFGSGFGNGFVTIEWVGSYTDPISGSTANNYLYMTDDYNQGASTNILNYNSPGVPFNYAFYQQTTPLALAVPPSASNYPSIFGPAQPFAFDDLANTNIYSYVSAQFTAASVSTNSVVGGALTNLPGRFEISATNELNLSLATIYGMNYLLLKSTNNFDTDFQSQISAPYADVYLGRTNGTFVVSNLLQSTLVNWNGNIQGWNTRWFYTDTNTGINYDYRVLLVESAVFPTSPSQQQDFVLYSSNNVVISDLLNITRTLSLNCTNLLLSTNGVGNGAGSVAGELNLLSSASFWAAATPRLRVLTNNGAIRTMNLTSFGSVSTPYIAFVNNGAISNAAGTAINAANFEHSGTFNTGVGSFFARSSHTVMTNASVTTAGTFTNITGTFIVSNVFLDVGRGLTIVATNLLTDGGSLSNAWSLGANNSGAGIAYGLNLAVKPLAGDLLGTTITNIATANSLIREFWSGEDRGYSLAGYSNNVAIGQLILDARGNIPLTQFYFAGAGVSNAIYVDNLVLANFATNVDASYNVKSLAFSNNLVIYYAQAMANGSSVAEKINHKNGDRLRWMPNYVGTFSSTNLVYPAGVTNLVNAALAQSTSMDSDGDGIVNASDATPFFTPALLDFTIAVSNSSPKTVRLQWQSIPNSTNYILYTTNLASPWQPFSGFNRWYYGNAGVTNAAHVHWFPSPLAYPSNPPVSDFRTNVWLFDTITNTPHFYRVVVQPWLTYPN